MADPIAFAEARLAETEIGAIRARSLRDKIDDPYRQIDPRMREGAEYTWHETGADPARALREVAAGRRILARHRPCAAGMGICMDYPTASADICPELADMLVRWADHVEYEPAWLPDEEARRHG